MRYMLLMESGEPMTTAGRFRCFPLRSPTLPPADHTNCYLVGRETALVVDPGSPYPREIQRLLHEIYTFLGTGGAIRAIFLTHHHGDHIGGVPRLVRALRVPLAAHPQTLARLPASCLQSKIPPLSIDDGEQLHLEPRLTLEAIHTPGHAPGHLCLFERNRGVLLSGDMIPGTGTTIIDPPEGEMAGYISSLERLSGLAPQWILPAHGPAIRGGQSAPRKLIQHRRWREHRVLSALHAVPRDLWTITKQAYDDTSPLMLPLARRSALAHLIKLAADGQALRDEGGSWRRIFFGAS